MRQHGQRPVGHSRCMRSLQPDYCRRAQEIPAPGRVPSFTSGNQPSNEQYKQWLLQEDSSASTGGSKAAMKSRLEDLRGAPVQWERISKARRCTIDQYELGVLITGVENLCDDYDLPFDPRARRYDARTDAPSNC